MMWRGQRIDVRYGVDCARYLVVLLVALGGCDRSAEHAPPRQVAAPSASVSPLPKAVSRGADGRCTPMPREGAACNSKDSYCVESWGKPGGSSSALWCRDGRWVREEEANLP